MVLVSLSRGIDLKMGVLEHIFPFCVFILTLVISAKAIAPSDSPHDADIGQSSYVGGDHNLDPESVSQFKQLWNATFNPDEKVSFSSPHTLC